MNVNSSGVSFLRSAHILLLENMEITEVTYTSRDHFHCELLFSPFWVALSVHPDVAHAMGNGGLFRHTRRFELD